MNECHKYLWLQHSVFVKISEDFSQGFEMGTRETEEKECWSFISELNCLCDLIFKRKFIYSLLPDSPKSYNVLFINKEKYWDSYFTYHWNDCT